MTPRWPAPNFVPQPRPVPLLGWALLAAGAAVLAVALGEVLDRQEALDDAATQVAHLEKRVRSASPVPRPGTAQTTPLSPEATRALRRIEQQLNQPWQQAFTGIESATPAGVQWLALEIDNEPTRLRVEGLAPTADAALAIVDALAVRAGWSNVVLTRLQVADAAPGTTPPPAPAPALGLQRFEVSARWSGPTRAEARP